MTLRWPDQLPMPQANSMRAGGPAYTDTIDVLLGPTRTRLMRRYASGTHDFEVWLTAAETVIFEDWYATVIAQHDGEWYAPWIGHGIVVAFAEEYDEQPQGYGWRVSGMLIQTRIDSTLCDDHINAIFGGIVRDELQATDVFKADLSSANIYRDDYPLTLIASEPC